jgi:hypothetical protein
VGPSPKPDSPTDRTLGVERAEVELSVVMPCLNEAETLELCIRKGGLRCAVWRKARGRQVGLH